MSSPRAANALRWVGMIGIAVISIMRMLIVFAPELHFDSDPATHPYPMAGMGPAGSLLLDVLLLLSCAITLLGEWLGRRGIEWRLLALALVPLPIVLWHGHADYLHLWRGMTWQAAIIGCAVIAHLARDRTMRMIIVALLIAAIAPLMVRGFSQVTVEHAQTIAVFEEHREQFLRDRGWEPGSSDAMIYERRLRQPQPLGWFTTTNIFASALLPLLALCAGLAIGLRRAKLPSGWMGLLFILAFASLIGIWLSSSKGAMLIALMAIALVILPAVNPRIMLAISRYAPVMLIALPFLALTGVLVRGFLPETFLGDRSLLFRWHYLVSSAGVFADAPLMGVGPDGYQEHYTRHRLPRNPEEVVSSHSMFVDWLCMLGILAMAWCALVFTMLLRAGRKVADPPEFIDGLDIEAIMRRLARTASLMVFLAFIPPIMAELHVLDGYDLTVRILGAVAFAALALVVGFVMLNVERPIVNWSLAVGAAAIIVHGQIEMTYFQGSFVVWGLCLLGVAGGAVMPNAGKKTMVSARLHVMWMVIIFVLAAWVAISGAIPAIMQAREVRAAATLLYPPADDPREVIVQRRAAGERLMEAYAILPRNRLPLRHAAHQFERAAMLPTTSDDERTALLLDAMELADRAVAEHPQTSSFAMRHRIATMLALSAVDVEVSQRALQTAIADAQIITERDPHGITGWRRLGDVLWLADRRAEAASAYRRALQADANFELDPLKQLTDAERNVILDRLRETDER